MRILVVGDLHGKMPVIEDKDFDCMVVTGDVCSDSILGPFHREFFTRDKAKGGGMGMIAFIRNKLGGQEYFDKAKRDSLDVGRTAMEYLDSFGKPVFMVAGNWDQSYGRTKIKDRDKDYYSLKKSFYDYYLGDRINPVLTEGLGNVHDCMFQCHEFGGVNFIGYGLSSGPEKFGMITRKKGDGGLNRVQVEKLKKAEKLIENKLKNAYRGRKNKKLPGFFISHNAPYGTKLDVVEREGCVRNGAHMGSTVARDFCLKFLPAVCVGGHVHEGKGEDLIGKTVVLNVGMGLGFVDFDEVKGRVKNVGFVG